MAIKVKFGICGLCDQGKEVVLYRRNPPECQYHYKLGKSIIYAERAEKKPKKKPSRIKGVSSKELSRLAKYRPVRDQYMKDHPFCEVEGCFKRSNNLHHRAGRIGSLLWDTDYFMACCEDCHPTKIHENPDWAREKGYLVTVC